MRRLLKEGGLFERGELNRGFTVINLAVYAWSLKCQLQ